MAGTLKVDSINADSNLTLKIANTAVAFIDATGLRPTSGNVNLDATATSKVFLQSANTVAIQTAGGTGLSMSSSQVVTLANALPVGSGGTGNTATPTAGGIVYGTGTVQAITAAGTSGQVLQSNGASAPTWAETNSGPFGKDLSFEDYSLTLSSGISAAALAQIWSQSVSLDGTSELMIIHSTSSAHAVVWNSSTNTFGTPILVRTASFTAAMNSIAIAKISTTQVLVSSLVVGGTALETVVLTVSGSTITVGTALATTLAAASTLIVPNTRLVTVGSSYVLNYFTTSNSLPKFRAITVSGSTPSIGSELAYAGGTASSLHHSYAHSATILLHFSFTAASFVYVLPISVSGTTLTAGTEATTITNGSGSTTFVTGALSNSRYALSYFLSTTARGAVVSVAGTVASISTAGTTMASSSFSPTMQVFGNQAFIQTGQTSGTDSINVIPDTSGTATLGTDLANPATGQIVGYLSTGKVFVGAFGSGASIYYQIGISSGSAVLEKAFSNITSTTLNANGVPPSYSRPLSGPLQSGSMGTSTSASTLRTTAGKIAITNTLLPFVFSIDGTNIAKLQQSANPLVSYNDAISEAVCWGFPLSQGASTTTVQLRKVTLV